MSRTVFYFTDSAGYGGAERALLTLLSGLERTAWQPVLIHHPEPGLAPFLEEARRLQVPLWCVPRMPDGLLGAQRMPGFARALSARRPDVFHAHLVAPLACKYALFAACLARIPAVVATVHLFVDFKRDPSIDLQQWLLATNIGCYLPVSEEVARRLRQSLPIPAHKLRVIRNAIDANHYIQPADPALRAHFTQGTTRAVVLALARLDVQKGLTYLLQAAAQVPEAVFVIAGDGPERAALEAQANALDIVERVIFLGHRTDVAELLACCDVFVLPSLYEGLPISVLEAMSAGKPVIATAVGGTDEAVRAGQTGLLVLPGDPAALAEALRLLLDDPAFARQLALAGQRRVQEMFTVAAMVQRVTHTYTEFIERR